MLKNDQINKDLVDFSPEPGLDTGGKLHFLVEMYGMDRVVQFNEKYVQNTEFSSY